MATKPTIPDLPPYSAGQQYLQPALIPKISRQGVDLASYDDEQLIELRAEIDELLPAKRLKDINLEEELVRQLALVQKLQRDVLRDDDFEGEGTPANQKAQCAGAVANVLAVLSKLQVEVYSSERMKRAESILVETITTLPHDTQVTFLDLYESKLVAANA